MTALTESIFKKPQKTPDDQVDWLTICNIDDITKNTGVCADFKGKQVAINTDKARIDGELAQLMEA